MPCLCFPTASPLKASVEEFKEFQLFDTALRGAQTADKESPVKSHGFCQDPVGPIGLKT